MTIHFCENCEAERAPQRDEPLKELAVLRLLLEIRGDRSAVCVSFGGKMTHDSFALELSSCGHKKAWRRVYDDDDETELREWLTEKIHEIASDLNAP